MPQALVIVTASSLTYDSRLACATMRPTGEVAEWSNVPDSKSGVRASVPWVRIPPSPPVVPRPRSDAGPVFLCLIFGLCKNSRKNTAVLSWVEWTVTVVLRHPVALLAAVPSVRAQTQALATTMRTTMFTVVVVAELPLGSQEVVAVIHVDGHYTPPGVVTSGTSRS